MRQERALLLHLIRRLTAAAGIAALTLVAPPPASAAAGPPPLEIRVIPAPGATDPGTLEGALHLLPAGGPAARDQEPVTVPVRRFGTVAVPLPAGTLWQVRAEIPGWWAPETVVTGGGDGLDLVLQPTGRLAGELSVVEKGATLPEEITVELVAGTEAPRRPGTFAAMRPCPVRTGRWSCEVPAGRHDLRFHAPGWASVFRWDVTIAAGATSEVERLVLTPGASLAGFVEIEGPRTVPVEVRLVPASDLAGAASARQDRLDALQGRTTADQHGLFQFRDLRPGSYALRATGDGLAPAVQGPIEVLPGREVVLAQPILLAPPLALEVRVRPGLPPDGVAWIVTAAPVGGHAAPREATADPTGTARLEQLAPGWHRLELRAGVRGERWWTGEVEIHRDVPPVEVDLPLVPIEGVVERGGEPVEAGLIFHRSGQEIRRHPEDGHFSAVLPEPGRWEVKARLRPSEPFVELDPIEVAPAPDGGAVLVELTVPDTLLRGEVVDAAGQPVRFGTVTSREESPPHRTSRGQFRNGRFELVGLPPGRHRVVGFLDGATADAQVDLRDGEVTTVRLVLRPPGRISGILLGGGRPLAGVPVWGMPERSPGGPLSSARTDPDGRFTLEVPAGWEGLRLLVLPYGFAAGDLAVEPLAMEEVVLEVPAFGGTLVLDGAEAGARLRRNGRDFPLPLLTDWAQLHGTFPRRGHWVLPSLAVGTYEVCVPAGDDERCDRGTLSAGGTLHLDVSAPRSAHEDPVALP